jgi:hypothetical protein
VLKSPFLGIFYVAIQLPFLKTQKRKPHFSNFKYYTTWLKEWQNTEGGPRLTGCLPKLKSEFSSSKRIKLTGREDLSEITCNSGVYIK